MKRLITFAFFCVISFTAMAQPSPPVADPNSLEAYLFQAFAASQARQRASLFHIGIETEQHPDGHLVTAVLEDYPAFYAGINRGDIIVTSNGRRFDPVTSFNSEINSQYDLAIDRAGSQREITVTPIFENLFDSYRNATASSTQEFSAGNKVIGYVRLWALSKNTSDIVTFKSLMAGLSHCDGLILDLRSAYGYLDDVHSNSFLPTPSGNDYFGKSVVVIVDSKTSVEGAKLARKLRRLDRIVVLGSETRDGLKPELDAPYPVTQTTRGDAKFETALNRLLGTI
jgi:C-terminal processing protease CtpA/Prc